MEHRADDRVVIEEAGVDQVDVAVAKFELEGSLAAAYRAKSAAAVGWVVVEFDQVLALDEAELRGLHHGYGAEGRAGFFAASGAMAVTHEHHGSDLEDDTCAKATSANHGGVSFGWMLE